MFGNLFKGFGWSSQRYPSRVSGSVKPFTRNKIIGDWLVISQQLAGKQPSQMRQALITADKTLDAALRDVVQGEAMGERLKNSRHLFDKSLYNKIWGAHKMRNALVHEAGYEPPHHMISKGIEDLKRGLSSLGVNIK